MIDVHFTLNSADGIGLDDDQMRQLAHVPRIGEFVSFDPYDSYVVVDVLWHLPAESQPYVSVTAFERNWQVNMREVEAAWRASGQ